jgi:hypothetical protein
LSSANEHIDALDEIDDDDDDDKMAMVKAKNKIRVELGQTKGVLMLLKKEYNKGLEKSKKSGIFSAAKISESELGQQASVIQSLDREHVKLVGKYEDKTLGTSNNSTSADDIGLSLSDFTSIGVGDGESGGDGGFGGSGVEMTGFGGGGGGGGGFGAFGGGGFGDDNESKGGGGGGGGYSDEGGFEQEELTEFDQQCLSTINEIQQDIDQDLDLIAEGIDFLKEAALAIGEELDVQSEMMKEVGGNVDKAQQDLERLNKNVGETLKEQANQNMCVYLICCIVMLGIVMVAYNLVKSATGSEGSNK